jgi:hypothetical protein
MKSWPLPKDPDDICDYQFDWSDRLEDGETIATSTFIVDQGTVVVDTVTNPATISGALTTFWLSGGVAGEVCVITNRIVTSEGRRYDSSGRLRIRSTS